MTQNSGKTDSGSLGVTDKGKIMNSFVKEYYDKGKAEGVAEGKAAGIVEGEARGKAETLIHQLEHKFGELPGDVEQRVVQAGAEKLDRWTLRILDAKELGEVFGERRH